jgi:hypothetical protein
VSTWHGRPWGERSSKDGARGAGKRGAGACSQAARRGLCVRPGNGCGSRERLWSGAAGVRVVRQVADRFRAHPLYRRTPSHRRATSRSSWTRRWSTIAFPFSRGRTMIDYLIPRLENYPHVRGTRPRNGSTGLPFESCLRPRSHSRSRGFGKKTRTETGIPSRPSPSSRRRRMR